MPAGNTYEAIATATASGGETTISFTSIPGTYTDLVIQGNTIATTPYELFVQFNNDTGTNYSVTYLEGNASAPSSGRSTTTASMAMAYSNSSNPTSTVIQIQNYSNSTTYKTLFSRSGAGSVAVIAYIGMWRSTSAITSIQLKLTGGRSFSAGATFSLYGIASA